MISITVTLTSNTDRVRTISTCFIEVFQGCCRGDPLTDQDFKGFLPVHENTVSSHSWIFSISRKI